MLLYFPKSCGFCKKSTLTQDQVEILAGIFYYNREMQLFFQSKFKVKIEDKKSRLSLTTRINKTVSFLLAFDVVVVNS